MTKNWIFYLLSGFWSVPCFAQNLSPNTFNAAGGHATVAGNSHEWSLGEMVLVNTATVGSNTITQGLLQPDYRHDADITENNIGSQNQFILYPNPSNGHIFLKPSLTAGTVLNITLVDMTGKVLYRNEAQLANGYEQQALDLTNYASGMYVLNVEWQQNSQRKTASYKLEKQ